MVKKKEKQIKQALEKKKVLTISEAAVLNDVTRQAIYVAIKLNKLKAKKRNLRWQIKIEDLQEYQSHKYSRTKSRFDGELIFDPNKGYYSVNQVAKMLDVPAQKIYYATRSGLLNAHRKGSAWVIQESDVKKYKEDYLDRLAYEGEEDDEEVCS